MSPTSLAPPGVTGLESPTLTAVLVAVALVVLLWGLGRYRASFSKAELGVAVAVAAGLVVLAFFPGLFGRLGAVLQIERRILVMALVANLGLAFLVLVLFARTRANQLTIAELTRGLTVQQAPTVEGLGDPVVFVVIPAYNEGEQVRDVVASLPERVLGYAVQPLVVSDGSADATAERAAATRAIVVEHPINRGQGGALQTGFDVAREHGADVVVTMDADGQHPVDQLGDLLEPIAEDRADYVVGSRYAGTDRSGNGPVRHLGIRTFTGLINLLAGTAVTDCTNGFRAIRGSRLGELTLVEERFSAPELLIEARKNGLRIEEVPVTVAPRAAGETKKPQVRYALGLARAILVTWIR